MKIDPNKKYSLLEISRSKLIPGCKSFGSVKNKVMRDSMGENILKAEIMGEGRATRIYIKGANLIKFVGN